MIQGVAVRFAQFQIAVQVQFRFDVPLLIIRGEIIKIIKFSHDSEFEGIQRIWAGPRQISHDYSHSKTITIHLMKNDEDDSEVSKVILLSRHFESWRDKPSRERELEKKLFVNWPLN